MRARPTVFDRRPPAARVVDAALRPTEQRVFWLDDRGPVASYPKLTGGTHANLVIVGGGYCGLWTAVLAKRRDPSRRVVLLEANTIGWAASGRNGGFCEASLTHGEANGRQRWAGEYDALDRLGHANLDAFERDVAELGLDCQFERTGELAVAVEPHQVQWLREEEGGTFLDSDAVRAEVASPTYLAGRWHEDACALVHPGRLASELARVATSLGVEIFEDTRATGVTGSGDWVIVRTAVGDVTADRVALATNAFPSLVTRYARHTIPVYDYVLMTEPLSPAQWADVGWAHRQGIGDLANQFHYYRPTADGRILFGGYDAIYRAGGRIRAAYEDRPETFRRLASHFFTTFPQLEGITFTHRWAGVIDTSTQFCAFHGLTHRGRVAYAAGFTGLGVGATRFAAEVMLDRLSGLDTERTRLRMVRRSPLPFPPDPVAAAGVAFTRWSLDRADHREGNRNPLQRVLDALGLGFDS
jgi:glycine/D-amino acid oxidase-like deaminating enzyme